MQCCAKAQLHWWWQLAVLRGVPESSITALCGSIAAHRKQQGLDLWKLHVIRKLEAQIKATQLGAVMLHRRVGRLIGTWRLACHINSLSQCQRVVYAIREGCKLVRCSMNRLTVLPGCGGVQQGSVR